MEAQSKVQTNFMPKYQFNLIHNINTNTEIKNEKTSRSY